MRRALNGRSLGLLEIGQYNAYPSAHTRLTPGPPDEVSTVRRAFALYLRPEASFASVARSLNGEGRAGLNASPWTAARCRQLLLNVRYAGDYLINIRRTDFGVTRRLPAAPLERVTGALPAIVDSRTFDAVQRKIARRSAKVTREQVLEDLRRVFRERGAISHHTLRLHGKWTPRVYTSRLGEIDGLYALCGAERVATHRDANLEAARRARRERGLSHSEADLLNRLRSLQAQAGFLTARLIDADPATPISRTYQIRFGSPQHGVSAHRISADEGAPGCRDRPVLHRGPRGGAPSPEGRASRRLTSPKAVPRRGAVPARRGINGSW